MDANLKAKWIVALRSGKYQQGGSYLQMQDRFCCLGVLCAVQGVMPELNKETFEHPWGDPMASDELPPSLSGGMSADTMVELAAFNDSGLSFTEIARYIEDNIPAQHKTDISVFCEMLKTQAPLVDHQPAVDTCANG